MSAGVLGATAVVLITAWMGVLDEESMPWEKWPATLRYIPWLAWQIILANWDIIKLAVSVRPELSPEMVALTHRLKTPYGQTTYANSITLTPGTVTIAIDQHTLLVHSISKAGAEDLRRGGMHDKVLEVFEGGHPRAQTGTHS
jgi:multicomponent Na+:H+ antiporter subunit E